MKRILLLAVVAAFALPGGAHAAIPCRDKIYNEWYSSGKISTHYPVACYRDALTHIPTDAKVYSNLGGDIKAAMQAAIGGATKPGGPGPSAPAPAPSAAPAPATHPHHVKAKSKTTIRSRPAPPQPIAIAPLASSHGGGVPTPILVLGALAILLALAGLVGTGVQQARKRRTA